MFRLVLFFGRLPNNKYNFKNLYLTYINYLIEILKIKYYHLLFNQKMYAFVIGSFLGTITQ